MKTITIKQPFATLIAEGYKEYEFRTWKSSYRGDILIHAGKSIDKKAMERFSYLNLEYPLGCIIAKANMTDCVEVNEEFSKRMIAKDKNVYHNLTKKRDKALYGFKMENVEKIEPIYVNGMLSLWEYNYRK